MTETSKLIRTLIKIYWKEGFRLTSISHLMFARIAAVEQQQKRKQYKKYYVFIQLKAAQFSEKEFN